MVVLPPLPPPPARHHVVSSCAVSLALHEPQNITPGLSQLIGGQTAKERSRKEASDGGPPQLCGIGLGGPARDSSRALEPRLCSAGAQLPAKPALTLAQAAWSTSWHATSALPCRCIRRRAPGGVAACRRRRRRHPSRAPPTAAPALRPASRRGSRAPAGPLAQPLRAAVGPAGCQCWQQGRAQQSAAAVPWLWLRAPRAAAVRHLLQQGPRHCTPP